ncbi:MAG: hypothetical protein KBT31_01470, partial [Firmicutes bacterium]|nr:hypothetical protein [Candidatus Colimorpha enterica]
HYDARSYVIAAYLDDKGNILWQRRIEHGFSTEHCISAVENGDGTLTVFTKVSPVRNSVGRFIYLSCFDTEGNELGSIKKEVSFDVRAACRFGDGYIVETCDSSDGKSVFCGMDREGNLTDGFSIEEEGLYYEIVDLAEYDGRLYLSASASRISGDETTRSTYTNTTYIRRYLYENYEMKAVPGEVLTSLMRENFTAVIFVCDPSDGTVKTYYSVKGSFGGELSVNTSGQLEWTTTNIVNSSYWYMNSFRYLCACREIIYTFDENGGLIGSKDTGRAVSYRFL